MSGPGFTSETAALRMILAGCLVAAVAAAIGVSIGGLALAARVTAGAATALLAATALSPDTFWRHPSTMARVAIDDQGRDVQRAPQPRIGRELYLLPVPSMVAAVACALLAA